MNKFVRKFPLINKIFRKISNFEYKIQILENENNILSQEITGIRIKNKTITGQKINVVFVCHRPNVWSSLKSVYETLKTNQFFNVTIVAIPVKKDLPKLGLNHEFYTTEGAEEFFKDYNCINGYDYEKKEWLDLRKLKPDYLFFQQPYNVALNPLYNSALVSKYCKICYVAYASNFIGNGVLEETMPKDFMKNVSLFFTQNEIDNRLVNSVLKTYENTFTRTFITGFPRYDDINKYKTSESSLWKFSREKNKFRIIWTPRWCTNEGNCNFFEYKDTLLEYADKNKDIDFIFRPHPQAFVGLNATRELPEKEADKYKAEYEKRENTTIDYQKEYFQTFFSSDCLVTDISSIIADYFLTGNPIIYCHKKDCFNELSRKLSEGFYWVKNKRELFETLDKIKNGYDPLKEKRQELITTQFQISDKTAGMKIVEIIKKDALGEL